ncbi:hypothetical protein EBU94_07565 [bacterium]|nr:hypothetical protein [bacterium]
MNKKLNEAVDTYSNVEFRDRVVGDSTPSKDNINLTLLSDIQTAAKKANVQVSVTTAVSGHRKGTRHQSGNAVDIAMINGKGWSDENSAKSKGIYNSIKRFVDELKNLGYAVNVKETGNPKVVLWFGYKNHNNHVHVSNKSGASPTQPPKDSTTTNDEDLPTPDDDSEEISPELSKALKTLTPDSKGLDLFGGKMDPLVKGFEKALSGFGGLKPAVNEQVDRIKKLMNL